MIDEREPRADQSAKFGLDNSFPTKPSDCYVLGMVIYETISGHRTFHKYVDLIVLLKILEGKRSSRGSGLVDSSWKILEWCWIPQPTARPSTEHVLQYLEQVLRPLDPPINRDANKRAKFSSDMFSHFITSTTFHGLSALCSPAFFVFTGPSLVHGEFLYTLTRENLMGSQFP